MSNNNQWNVKVNDSLNFVFVPERRMNFHSIYFLVLLKYLVVSVVRLVGLTSSANNNRIIEKKIYRSISHQWLKPRALTQLLLIALHIFAICRAFLLPTIHYRTIYCTCSEESQENILKMLRWLTRCANTFNRIQRNNSIIIILQDDKKKIFFRIMLIIDK